MRRRGRGVVPEANPAPADPDVAPAQFDSPWLLAHLTRLVGRLRGRALCVAYSGGLDSGALLLALAQLRTGAGFRLRAVHIDHRLQPASRQWARDAAARARRLRVACRIIAVNVASVRGESLEAAARTARYRALGRALAPGEWLLTAHHQEDQLETLLLALLRGSGVRGLAAMSAVTPWAHTWLIRPLLPVARPQLEHYARAHGLDWTEDPSNADTRFDRNYLRQTVVPLIRRRWPAAAATVARSAAHMAEARVLLEQSARRALADARDGAALRVTALRRLSAPALRNALRQWLAERGLGAPDHRRLREIAGPMLSARADAMPRVRWPGGEVRRHGDLLYAFRGAVAALPSAPVHWDWRSEAWLALPGGGAIGLLQDSHGDVRLEALPARLVVRFRGGGERLSSARPHRSLKDLLQSHGLAPWERSAAPLIEHDEKIIAVADLWVDGPYRAPREQGGSRGRFRWRRPATA